VAFTEPAVSGRPYAAADLAFGLDVLKTWCSQDPAANIVLSPSSLASGLGMAYLGARGTTATAMATVLHLPAGGSLEAGLQARARALRDLDGPGVTVAEADRVWADPSLLPLRSYLNAVATGYGAGLGEAPLQSDPAAAARQIDAAIGAATRGHITRLLTAQDLEQTAFVLTDALYLRASWATPFQPASTTTSQFLTASGRSVQASYLNGGPLPVAMADGWTAVGLPYRGGKLEMTALLPPAGAGQTGAGPGVAACPDPAAATVAALVRAAGGSGASRAGRAADLALPQVSLRSQATLNGVLTTLGMGVAFSSSADFAGISPAAAAIGVVVHAATLRVDAAGTVGSAATGVTIMPTAMQAHVELITFDRPYLLVVSSTTDGEPLFLARVADPDQP
jgi:serine protease inhibitor